MNPISPPLLAQDYKIPTLKKPSPFAVPSLGSLSTLNTVQQQQQQSPAPLATPMTAKGPRQRSDSQTYSPGFHPMNIPVQMISTTTGMTVTFKPSQPPAGGIDSLLTGAAAMFPPFQPPIDI